MSHQLRHLRGLPPEQLTPRKGTVGAALRVGKKDPERGFPIDKDLFYIVETETVESTGPGRKFEYRPVDRRFDGYHMLQKSQRRKFYGMIAQHTEPEIWTPRELAHRGPGRHPDVINPPGRKPWCHGNGKEAQRWDGSDYADIACPGIACPFQQKTFKDARGKLYAPCGPQATFYFMPRWPAFLGDWAAAAERPLMKLVSKGRQARETFAGMFEDVRAAAQGPDPERPLYRISSWFGLPWTVSLGARTNAEERTRYPVMTFALDGDPLAWLRWQGEKFQGLLEAPKTVLALGASSSEELDAEAVGGEQELVSGTVTTKPATFAEPKAKAEPEALDIEPEPSLGHRKIETPEEFSEAIDSLDPRSLKQMIEEDFVEAGFPRGRVNPVLLKAGLRVARQPLPEDADRAAVRKAISEAWDALKAKDTEPAQD